MSETLTGFACSAPLGDLSPIALIRCEGEQGGVRAMGAGPVAAADGRGSLVWSWGLLGLAVLGRQRGCLPAVQRDLPLQARGFRGLDLGCDEQ